VLVAVTGMRIGEAIGLDGSDVDPGERVIVIRGGTFGNPRQLVIHRATADVLAAVGGPVTRTGRSLRPARSSCPPRAPGCTSRTSRRCSGTWPGQAGVSCRDGRPRGCTTGLAGWQVSGTDAAPLLPAPSAYLVHVVPADTYWYLSACPELLGQATRRLENLLEEHS
jgi:integrase/recombinase XerD